MEMPQRELLGKLSSWNFHNGVMCHILPKTILLERSCHPMVTSYEHGHKTVRRRSIPRILHQPNQWKSASASEQLNTPNWLEWLEVISKLQISNFKLQTSANPWPYRWQTGSKPVDAGAAIERFHQMILLVRRETKTFEDFGLQRWPNRLSNLKV